METFNPKSIVMNHKYFRTQIFKFIGGTPQKVIQQKKKFQKVLRDIGLFNDYCQDLINEELEMAEGFQYQMVWRELSELKKLSKKSTHKLFGNLSEELYEELITQFYKDMDPTGTILS